MEPSNTVILDSKCQVVIQGSTMIESKILDSISSIQNSSQICVSKLDLEIPNSQNSLNQNNQPDKGSVLNFSQSKQKAQLQNEEMSAQSEQQEMKNVVKSGRQQKFKRSTNNSHKKFISVARRWMFKNNRSELKVAFENKFNSFRSTRTYFFIILAFIKSKMNEEKQRQFSSHFIKQVSAKIVEYEKQIQNTQNENLKHFRSDEVTDLKYSIKACEVYFQGDIEKSIECVYKKDKNTIVKKHHYQEALKIVKGIELQFQSPTFVQDIINLFGGKKSKSKSSTPEQSILDTKQNSQEKLHSRFLFPEMFGLKKTNFTFDNQMFGRKAFPIRQTQECEEESREQDKFVQKDRITENAQKINLMSNQNRKKMNVLVITPRIQNNHQIAISSFQKSIFSTGFKPYQIQ